MVALEFEKPLVELEEKLEEMRAVDANTTDVDLSEEIEALETRVAELHASIYQNLTRWQRVQIARHPERPYTLDFIEALSNNFVELHGDRRYADDHAIVGGLATLEGHRFGYTDRTVMFIGHQKGRDTKSRKFRRFGMPNPEGYRKALRLMETAVKFRKPVVTLIDTPGAYPGMGAEERGQAEAIARNLFEMSRLEVPIIVVIIGEGASGGAIGIGVGDRIFMLENSWYSVIAPESCSSILWHSWDHKEDAAEALKLTAPDLLNQQLIDDIIEEPLGGAHRDREMTYEATGHSICTALRELDEMTTSEMLEARLEKFNSMGVWRSAAGKTANTD
jgi:acetyl-CoA carboxylase carboxyl transferase subunit alpha